MSTSLLYHAFGVRGYQHVCTTFCRGGVEFVGAQTSYARAFERYAAALCRVMTIEDIANDLMTRCASISRYLCHGHTHVARDQRIGPTRVINPGALCRAPRLTVATLDTEADTLTFYPVDQPW